MSNTALVASATIQTVTFNNQTIPVILHNGIAYAAVKPIAENIGLDWEAQRKRIQRHEVLNSATSMMEATGSDSKKYKMLCLPITMLNGWLFGVDVNRVKPAAKAPLIQYQKACFQTLYEHFHSTPKPYAPTKENIFSEAHNEVVDYLWSLYEEIKRLGGTVPAQPKFDSQAICNAYIRDAITFDRLMLSFDQQGEAKVRVLSRDKQIMADSEMAKRIKDPFAVGKEHLADIAQAALGRLGKLIN